MDGIWLVSTKGHNEETVVKKEIGDDAFENEIGLMEDNRRNEQLSVDDIIKGTAMKQGAENTFQGNTKLADGTYSFSDKKDKQNNPLNIVYIKEEPNIKMEAEDNIFEGGIEINHTAGLNLNNHLEVHNDNTSVLYSNAEMKRKFECDICHKPLTCKSYLRELLEANREEKQLKCETCEQKCSQKSKNSKKVVHSQGRQIVHNVYEFMKKEKELKKPIKLEQVQLRVAEATGVSLSTVKRIISEHNANPSGCFSSPRRTINKSGSKSTAKK